MVTESEQVCRYFKNCEGCSHCSDAPHRCEYCADPWDECLCDFKALPDDDEDGGELFTACASCGAFGIPIDGEGMAAELCEACEDLPAVQVVTLLSRLYTDRARLSADESEAIAEAIRLIRTHALPTSHPWGIE